MSGDRNADVVIVGGGHAGLLLGVALSHGGIAVRLVERQARAAILAAPADGRSLALLAGSMAILRRVGAWPQLAPHAEPVERVEVVDVEGGGQVRYDSERHGKGPFGAGVEHASLRRALLEAFLTQAGDDAWQQGEVASQRRVGDLMEVTFADGSRCRAPLVVGADGRASRVRELAGITVDRWAYDQHALAMVVRHQHPHRGTVREWMRRGGPLAILPLRGRRTGVTWVERKQESMTLAALSRTDLLAAFTQATGGVLGTVEVESGPTFYPLGAQHARTYVAPRVVLVGDAAHGVHPIHAQGFNMGVADVGALADALQSARARGLDLGSGEALLPYARARRGDNTQRLWLTDGLARLFAADLGPLRTARSLALDAIERVPPLKRLAVRHGMQTG
jgi:2-octaprenyl-6-methoxyphenol hydroxylase